jgi:signal transduction histidine kinase
VYEPLIERAQATAVELALQQAPWASALETRTEAVLREHARRTRTLLRGAIVDGDWPPYIDHLRDLGAIGTTSGILLSSWSTVIRGYHRRLIPPLVDAYAVTPPRLSAALAAMLELIELSLAVIAEPYEVMQRELVAHERVASALAARTQELEDSNRALEAFSYSVAHDLRAPLRAMNGFAQILLEDHAPGLEPEAVAYLRKIENNANRMGVLIDALLGLARLSRSTLQLQPVDLSALARAVVAQLVAAEPSRAVDVSIDAGLIATADGRLVRSVLDNLIGNAWKFTARSVAPKIAVGSTDGSTFFVRDNGIGFDMVHASKLFAPFERMHTVDEFPGTGIGLAIVQRIVHRHGGRISVDARRDAGATFFFTLGPAPAP